MTSNLPVEECAEPLRVVEGEAGRGEPLPLGGAGFELGSLGLLSGRTGGVGRGEGVADVGAGLVPAAACGVGVFLFGGAGLVELAVGDVVTGRGEALGAGLVVEGAVVGAGVVEVVPRGEGSVAGRGEARVFLASAACLSLSWFFLSSSSFLAANSAALLSCSSLLILASCNAFTP